MGNYLLSLHLFRRIHPVRCIRFALLLVFVIIVISSVWQFIAKTGDKEIGDAKRIENQFEQLDSRTQEEPSKNTIHPSRTVRDGLDRKNQAMLDYIGNNLDIHYNVMGNQGGQYFVDLIFTNKGAELIESCCWAIYFYHMKFLDTNAFNSGFQQLLMNDGRMQDHTKEAMFTMIHINGYTFRLQPTNRFPGLEPGENFKLQIMGGGWAVSRSEVVPNWYVANDYSPSEPRLIKSTVGEQLKFVGDFDPAKRWARSEEDVCLPFSAEQRFAQNKVHDFGSAKNSILPTPLSVTNKNTGRKVELDGSDWVILYVNGLENEAKYIQAKFNISSSKLIDIPTTSGKAQCHTKSVVLHLSENMPKSGGKALNSSEKYVLVIGSKRDCISIFSPSAAGVFYGAVSLTSLAVPAGAGKHLFSGIVVVDAPRYRYRGVMVDVVRHFHTQEDLVRLMNAMAMYKLNKLHLHLADDEGWRLEIPGLEELTTVGGRRGHDLHEKKHLMSMIGSGPFTNSSGSGFYTVDDYKSILRFAKSHHIEVIPEFDMPGHSHAAIKSMEARYTRLQAKGQESEGLKFLLSDLSDRSAYLSGQFFKDSAINPCIESSYTFVDHVVARVVEMHKDVLPLRLFHFGGDEVPSEAYTGSPACAEFLSHHKKMVNSKDLKTYFVRRVTAIVARYGLAVMGWEDAFSMSHGQPISIFEMEPKEVISQAWYNIWESGLAHRAYLYANVGYKVVLSPTTNFYYDNPHEPDPEDWGLHWATRYVSTKRSFNFMPEAMYDSIDFDFWGRPINKMDLCATHHISCEPLHFPDNIIGIEGVMWSELIRTSDRLDSMLWPRLLALAERSWHKASWETIEDSSERLPVRKEDWTNFANVVGYKELKRLEEAGVNYYIPRPGARVRHGLLYVNTAFPGIVIQVSSDEGKTWNDYDINTMYRGHLLLATRSFDGNRRSVPVALDMSDFA